MDPERPEDRAPRRGKPLMPALLGAVLALGVVLAVRSCRKSLSGGWAGAVDLDDPDIVVESDSSMAALELQDRVYSPRSPRGPHASALVEPVGAGAGPEVASSSAPGSGISTPEKTAGPKDRSGKRGGKDLARRDAGGRASLLEHGADSRATVAAPSSAPSRAGAGAARPAPPQDRRREMRSVLGRGEAGSTAGDKARSFLAGKAPQGVSAGSADRAPEDVAAPMERDVWCALPQQQRLDALKGFTGSGITPNHPLYKKWMDSCPSDPSLLKDNLICGKWPPPEPGKSCVENANYCITPRGYMPALNRFWNQAGTCFIQKYQREHEKKPSPIPAFKDPRITVRSYACDGLPENTIYHYDLGRYRVTTDEQAFRSDHRGNYVHIDGPAGRYSYKVIFDPDCGEKARK